jgi:hypothetical protein
VMDEQNHPITYEMTIHFNKDGVTVTFTGEAVKFSEISDSPVRPRHLRIVNDIHKLLREYIRDN